MKLFMILALFLSGFCAFAHSGKTDSTGCHNDNKNGGRHCHGSKNSSTESLENFKSTAQTDHEQVQEGFNKNPAIKQYVSNRGGEKLFDKPTKAPEKAEVPADQGSGENVVSSVPVKEIPVSPDVQAQGVPVVPVQKKEAPIEEEDISMAQEEIQEEVVAQEKEISRDVANSPSDHLQQESEALDSLLPSGNPDDAGHILDRGSSDFHAKFKEEDFGENENEEELKRELANQEPIRKVKKINYDKKYMIFYNEHCETPSSCVKVPVLTNMKSVMFEYSIRDEQ